MSDHILGESIPKHVAIIMDGNGRWAEKRHRPRVYGHVRGATRVKPIVRRASDLGVEALTLFAFSTENWFRPHGEIQTLWKLLKKYLVREAEELDRNNVRIGFIGQIERLDPGLREMMEMLRKRLSKNTGLRLTFAISYGSRAELVQASQRFASDCIKGEKSPEQLDETLFSKYLWTDPLEELSDVDLVIRTSGENRISNFLLWQAAYAEYAFVDTYWPDFGRKDFDAALREYSHRDRRFGAVREEGEPDHEKKWKGPHPGEDKTWQPVLN